MIFRVPALGEGVQEAELLAWRVAVGDVVRPGTVLMEVMTDKATAEIPSPFAGTITALNASVGERLTVGASALAYRSDEEQPDATPTEGPPEPVAEPVAEPVLVRAEAPKTRRTAAAPAVRLAARELGIDLDRMSGSGPGGRVLIRDLVGGSSRPAAAPSPGRDWGTPGTEMAFQGLRRQIAERLAEAHRSIPQATYVDEIDVSALVRLRDELRSATAAEGIKLTYLPFFVRAAALALREVPIVNSSLEGDRIVLHAGCHVGVAVDAPQGLLVPVARDADRGDLLALARELGRLAEGARRGGLNRDELTGGTFTVTSIGGLGGLFAAPLVNPPQAAILGFGKVVRRPRYDARGELVPADVVYAAISFDHRILDGGAVAAFGNALARRLTAPAALLTRG